MNRYLIVSGIAVLLIAVCFSGCNEQDGIIGDNDKVEITGYSVKTYWFDEDYEGEETFANVSGFHPELVYDAWDDLCFILVYGNVLNIGNEFLDMVEIEALFTDADGDVVAKQSKIIYDLPKDYPTYFEISIDDDDTIYFQQITGVRFELTAI